MTRAFADPRVIVALAALSAGAALSPAPLAIRVPFALPLAIVLPGLALSLAFLPDTQGWLGRLPVSVATSVCVTAISGLLLTWSSIGLTRFVWVPVLAGVTIVGAALAWRRLPPSETTFPDLMLGVPGRPAVAVLVAAALLVAAISLARTPLSSGNVRGYSALWILPVNEEPDSVRIGVISSEFRETSFRVAVYAQGRVLFARPLTLSTGERWTGVVDVSAIPVARRSFDVQLVRTDRPGSVYREATLILPGSQAAPTTAVWLVPGPPTSTVVRVLATSAEPRRERFRLELRVGGRVYRVLQPVLRSGERWSNPIDLAAFPPGQKLVEALLYRNADSVSDGPYRSAKLVVTLD